ncbi:triose-phosphate isomerase [Dermatophilus congolensis]|uniref:Triosephosphate isomerase n=1 Tax=Dermatophilus congolensis TaxID=1863 RepID=A0A239VNV3_9MICO|nr:triose-phosphate isomerase [Dermatophilus congolensis]MBO3129497.1 triose-phosphate isomerase [Dermatophilus congolensis]MBO3131870.1 triose-phosphate isomerase [Dermatophilus congolensis]MBO3133973.1 triose-phosphate isomerase [Dermatophilus congolensis]MBO3136204.1 triose-phosphate isomerase [Dermatophilus congolensis]MBO3138450.1 triose-phosphate isomerase [Dermatophilus congolensis]
MSNRTPLMAGNWKMNLDHQQGAHLVQKLDWALKDAKHDFEAVEVAVVPPFTDIRTVQTLVEGDNMKLAYGAQDISEHDGGAYTGEISGDMLKALGCTYVLVGHSERREYHHESDELLNRKVKAAYRHGLTPILCCGEALEVRKENRQVEHVLGQIEADLAGIPVEQVKSIVIAYEPIWAIGTGEVATPADAQEVCAAIRGKLAELYDQQTAEAVRVLYGGSVKAGNVVEIMAQPDVDGALVGGASLKAEDFTPICTYQQAGN